MPPLFPQNPTPQNPIAAAMMTRGGELHRSPNTIQPQLMAQFVVEMNKITVALASQGRSVEFINTRLANFANQLEQNIQSSIRFSIGQANNQRIMEQAYTKFLQSPLNQPQLMEQQSAKVGLAQDVMQSQLAQHEINKQFRASSIGQMLLGASAHMEEQQKRNQEQEEMEDARIRAQARYTERTSPAGIKHLKNMAQDNVALKALTESEEVQKSQYERRAKGESRRSPQGQQHLIHMSQEAEDKKLDTEREDVDWAKARLKALQTSKGQRVAQAQLFRELETAQLNRELQSTQETPEVMQKRARIEQTKTTGEAESKARVAIGEVANLQTPQGMQQLEEQLAAQKRQSAAQEVIQNKKNVAEYGKIGGGLINTQRAISGLGFGKLAPVIGTVTTAFSMADSAMTRFVAAASPSHAATLEGSKKLFEATMGLHLLPYQEGKSSAYQALAGEGAGKGATAMWKRGLIATEEFMNGILMTTGLLSKGGKDKQLESLRKSLGLEGEGAAMLRSYQGLPQSQKLGVEEYSEYLQSASMNMDPLEAKLLEKQLLALQDIIGLLNDQMDNAGNRTPTGGIRGWGIG